MARIIDNTVILNSGAALELDQVASICAGPFAGSRATDSQIRESHPAPCFRLPSGEAIEALNYQLPPKFN